MINDGVDGLLFDSESNDDLSQKLELLMANETLRKKLGGQAYKRWQNEFTESRYHKRNFAFYSRVISISK